MSAISIAPQNTPFFGSRKLLKSQLPPSFPHSFRSLAAVSPQSTETPPPLVVVGSANADIFLEIDRLPGPGETLSARNCFSLPGGKGANQAACAAKISYPTHFLGQVGDDSHGALILESLRNYGVHVDHVREVPGVPTGNAVVLLQPNGENSIIISGGANVQGWPNDFSQEDLEIVKNAGIVLLQREIPDSINLRIAEAAMGAGVSVILDAGGMDSPLSSKLLSAIDFLSPNESELSRITGLPTETMEQIEKAVLECHGMGVKKVLVKLGERGSALFVEGDEPILQPIVAAGKVVDTTGAGDTFTAAFAVALLEGKSTPMCLRFAAAAASLCIEDKGAMPSMPDREAVLNRVLYC